MTEIESMREALEKIKLAAEQHSCFMGYEEDGVTEEDINSEGGDAAFVTLDIAWRAKKAIAKCNFCTLQLHQDLQRSMKKILEKKWYVVCAPWGDGTWIRAGSPDASGEYVVDCKSMIDVEDGGLDDQQASQLAEYLVSLHNNNLMYNAKVTGTARRTDK